MKKGYIKPEIQVVRLLQTQMLCSSPQSLANEEYQLLDSESEKIISESDVW